MSISNNRQRAIIAICSCGDHASQIQIAPWHGYEVRDGEVKLKDREIAFTILDRPNTKWECLKTAWRGLMGDGFESNEVIVPTEDFLKMAEEVRNFHVIHKQS